MESAALNILILNETLNNAEEIISALRRGGVASNIVRPKDSSDLEQLLSNQTWHLAIHDGKHDSISSAQLKQLISRFELFLPWHYLCEDLSTDNIAEGIQLGANDSISMSNEAHLIHAILRDSQHSSLWQKHKQLLAQANEFDKRQSQLIDASSDAIAYISDGIILSCNDSFAEQLDRTKEELSDMPLFDFIDSSCRDNLKIALKKAISGDIEYISLTLSSNQQQKIDARLVTTYYEGESAIQLNFKIEQASTEANNSIHTEKRKNIPNLLGELDRLAQKKDGVLIIIDIDKTAQFKVKLGPSAGRIIIDQAINFIQKAIVDLDPWTYPLSDNSLVVYTQKHTLGSIRDRLPLILKEFEQHLFEYNDRTVQMTCSIGVASLTEDITAGQWLDNTYQAMFEARSENDGNAFKLFTADIRAGVAGNTGMTLDDALSLKRFKMSFQPLVSVKDSEHEYFESYLRMLDQNDEEISPSVFIDAFTQREFNTKLDRWVLLECFKQLAEAQKSNPDIHLIINLTANALNDDKLLPWIAIAIRTAGIDPKTLVFQFMADNIECYLLRAIKVFKQFEQLGCETSINRIGENDNSLKIFEKVKPRFAKLAPRFMQALQQDNNPELLKQILKDIDNHGVEGIVGFVESANTMAMLWQMSASLIQGYYIAAPTSSLNHNITDF